jgi:hypothetical protein
MASESSKARRILRDEVECRVVPILLDRGFLRLDLRRGTPPAWSFNRKRQDNGYDAILVMLEDGYRPLFDAILNVIPKSGIHRPWGEYIDPSRASAADLPDRAVMAGIAVRNPTLRALLRWQGIGWFGFRPKSDAAFNKRRAGEACAKFIACLDQAEEWFRSGVMGPNLVKEHIGIVLQNPDLHRSADPCKTERP